MSRKQICKIIYVLIAVVFVIVNTLSVFAVVNHVYSCIACVPQEIDECSEFAKLTDDSRRFCLIDSSNTSEYFNVYFTVNLMICSHTFCADTLVTCKVKMNN